MDDVPKMRRTKIINNVDFDYNMASKKCIYNALYSTQMLQNSQFFFSYIAQGFNQQTKKYKEKIIKEKSDKKGKFLIPHIHMESGVYGYIYIQHDISI